MSLPRPENSPEPSSRPHGRSHCSPRHGRLLVCALYHEVRRRKQPMTHMADALRGSAGWRIAEERFPGPAGSKPAG